MSPYEQRLCKPGSLFVAEKQPLSRRRSEWVGVLTFTAAELRAIALALGPNDRGGDDMEELADWLDELNDLTADSPL